MNPNDQINFLSTVITSKIEHLTNYYPNKINPKLNFPSLIKFRKKYQQPHLDKLCEVISEKFKESKKLKKLKSPSRVSRFFHGLMSLGFLLFAPFTASFTLKFASAWYSFADAIKQTGLIKDFQTLQLELRRNDQSTLTVFNALKEIQQLFLELKKIRIQHHQKIQRQPVKEMIPKTDTGVKKWLGRIRETQTAYNSYRMDRKMNLLTKTFDQIYEKVGQGSEARRIIEMISENQPGAQKGSRTNNTTNLLNTVSELAQKGKALQASDIEKELDKKKQEIIQYKILTNTMQEIQNELKKNIRNPILNIQNFIILVVVIYFYQLFW